MKWSVMDYLSETGSMKDEKDEINVPWRSVSLGTATGSMKLKENFHCETFGKLAGVYANFKCTSW